MTTLEQSIRHVRQVLTDTPGATTASFERAAVRDLLRAVHAPVAIETLPRDTLVTPTLRDQFAMRAMQAAATNPAGADGFTFEERAAWAYQQADAMLAARGCA